MKRVLLIPSDHGGGRGHVSRCIYLAKKLQSAGHEAALVLENKHFQEGIEAGIATFLLDTKKEKILKFQFRRPFWPGIRMVEKPGQPPIFLMFSGLAYQVPRDQYLSYGIVMRRFKRLSKIIEQFKPDILVGDTHFLTFLLGKKFSLPVVQITRLAGFPPAPHFLWWMQHPPQMVEPQAVKPFEPLIERLGLLGIKRAEDLLRGDLYLIPATSKIEPIAGHQDKLLFCGPLTENSMVDQKISFFEEPADVPNIYVTAGGGANRFGQAQFFEAILNVFDKRDFRVLVSTGGLVPAKNLNGRSTNVFFVDWIDGLSAIRKSDLVIHHGGYGSMMETLLSGKPSIAIPFHSEQEGNGRRLKELGIGDFYLPFTGKMKEIIFSWPFGMYSMLAGFNLTLQAEELIAKIDQIYDQALYQRIKKVSDELSELQRNFDVQQMIQRL